jgi:glutaredoxin
MTDDPQTVVFYWRPGCRFCSDLHRDLVEAGVDFDSVNIWEDREGARFVRSVAWGNETVPTVVVGDHAMVNPGLDEVLHVLRRAA